VGFIQHGADQDGSRPTLVERAQALQRLPAIEAGHHDVKGDDVGLKTRRQPEGLSAIMRDVDGVGMAHHVAAKHLDRVLIVVYD